MKSPTDLGTRLVAQWDNTGLREARLLDSAGAYPIDLPIGDPAPAVVDTDPAAVRAHLNQWRAVNTGEVHWVQRQYRRLSEPVAVPTRWRLRTVQEWADAAKETAPADNKTQRMLTEFARYLELLPAVDPRFHRYLVRQPSTVSKTETGELITAAEMASTLKPGQAQGLPLRAMPVLGADTKIFERRANLLTKLLDLRFDGQVSVVGLEQFLGAAPPSGRWLLIADLDGNLLPYQHLRLTGRIIEDHGLPGRYLLVVENEKLLHTLPKLADTIAVLGPGNDLGWLSSPRLIEHSVVYWGDLDTWGLSILAQARCHRPDLRTMLMDVATFDTHSDLAVKGPSPAPLPEHGLTAAETDLFNRLALHPRGQLEQERLPTSLAHDTMTNLWTNLRTQDC